jgi:Flp pilus assembly pilin Flp
MFQKMLKKFMTREEGSVFAEYALLLSLIAIVTIAAVSALGSRIVDLFVAIEMAIGGI